MPLHGCLISDHARRWRSKTPIMMASDNRRTAVAIARQAGITRVLAGCCLSPRRSRSNAIKGRELRRA